MGDKNKKNYMTYDASSYMNGELYSPNKNGGFLKTNMYVSWLWQEVSNLSWKNSVANGLVEKFEDTKPNLNKEQKEVFELLKSQVGYLQSTTNKINESFGLQKEYKDITGQCLIIGTLDKKTKGIEYDIVDVETYFDSEIIERMYELNINEFVIEKVENEMCDNIAKEIEVTSQFDFRNLFFGNKDLSTNIALLQQNDEEAKFVCLFDTKSSYPLLWQYQNAYALIYENSDENFFKLCSEEIHQIVSEHIQK